MTMKAEKQAKKIGLALGGGAILGAAHIGVMGALEERNIKISSISGTSIGDFISPQAKYNAQDRVYQVSIILRSAARLWAGNTPAGRQHMSTRRR